jgi:hypothetical protein
MTAQESLIHFNSRDSTQFQMFFDYLVNTLGSEVYSTNNPHRAQWQTCFEYWNVQELLNNIGL